MLLSISAELKKQNSYIYKILMVTFFNINVVIPYILIL